MNPLFLTVLIFSASIAFKDYRTWNRYEKVVKESQSIVLKQYNYIYFHHFTLVAVTFQYVGIHNAIVIEFK